MEEIQEPSELKEAEFNYFRELVGLELERFQSGVKHSQKKITAMALSYTKEYLLVAYSSCEVLLFRTSDEGGAVVGKVLNLPKAAVVQAALPFDGVSQLLCLDSAGEVHVYFNGYNLSDKGASSVGGSPMNYFEYYSLAWQHLTQSQKREEKEAEELRVSCAQFHPALTVTLVQPFLMLGAHNGTVMKFNNNKDLFKGKVYRYPIFTPVNGQVLTRQDVELPNEFHGLIAPIENEQEYLDRRREEELKPVVSREFFLQHRARIIHICFTDSPDHFLTVDADGFIFYFEYDYNWFYKDTSQIGYKPKNKFQVMCYTWVYEPARDENNKECPVVERHKEWKEQSDVKGKEAYTEYI